MEDKETYEEMLKRTNEPFQEIMTYVKYKIVSCSEGYKLKQSKTEWFYKVPSKWSSVDYIACFIWQARFKRWRYEVSHRISDYLTDMRERRIVKLKEEGRD